MLIALPKIEELILTTNLGGKSMAEKELEKKSDGDYYSRAILFVLIGLGAVVGTILLLFKFTGTLR